MSNGNPWLTSVSSPPILPFDAGPTAHLALPSTVGPPKLPLVELVRFSRLRSSCVDYLSIIYVWNDDDDTTDTLDGELDRGREFIMEENR